LPSDAVPVSGEKTMSSIEIAELTGKRHDNVIRDLKELEEQGVLDLLRFEDISRDSMNRKQFCYTLPKLETLILTSGYSAKQRAAIIDRWLSLEEQVKQSGTLQLPDFTDPAAAAEAWAEEYRDKMTLLSFAERQAAMLTTQQTQLTEQAPMVEFAEAVIADDTTYKVGEAAKMLGVGPHFLFQFLRDHKWMNKDNSPRQSYVDAKDVAEALGYKWKGPVDNLGHIPTEWKGVRSVRDPA